MKLPKQHRQQDSVVVVFGPPLSGKNYYVDQHRQSGDIVWDQDEILQAITGLPRHETCDGAISFVLAMRDAFARVALEESRSGRVWMILSADKGTLLAHCKMLGMGIVAIVADKETCLSRAKWRDSSRPWAQIIEDWFEKEGNQPFWRQVMASERRGNVVKVA